MPEVVDETVKQGRSNLFDGVKYGGGRGIGLAVAGPIGYSIGGVAGAATLSSEAEKATLSTLAIADGLTMLLNSGGGQQARTGGVR